MYWADWGNHPKIETAAMDGTLRQTLVHENIQWPTGQNHLDVLSKFTLIGLRKVKHSCFFFGKLSASRSQSAEPILCLFISHKSFGLLSAQLHLFCLHRFGCGLLQRASVLGRC